MNTHVRCCSSTAYASRPLTRKRPLPSASTTKTSERLPGVRLRTATFAAGASAFARCASARQVSPRSRHELGHLEGFWRNVRRAPNAQVFAFGVEKSRIDVAADETRMLQDLDE